MERETISFAGKKMNYDDSLDVMPMGDGDRLNVVYPTGDMSQLESLSVPTNIATTYPSGTNIVIGQCQDLEKNAVIYFVANSNNRDSIKRIYSDNTIENISYDQNWGFDKEYPITKAFVIGTGTEAMLFFTDKLNPPRLVNISTIPVLVYDSSAYPKINDIKNSLLKPSPTSSLEVELYYNLNVITNNIYGKLFQFAYRYLFIDGQRSSLSHWSQIAYNSQEFITGQYYKNYNSILLTFQDEMEVFLSGEQVKIELFVKICDIGGVTGSWKLYDTLDSFSSGTTYSFTNDKEGYYIDQAEALSLFDNIPLKSGNAELIDNRIVLAENNSGYDDIDIDVDLSTEIVRNLTQSSSFYMVSGDFGGGLPYLFDFDVLITLGIPVAITIVIVRKNLEVLTRESYYTYSYTGSSSFGHQSNYASAVNLIDQINRNTQFKNEDGTNQIVATLLSGGHPNRIRIAKFPYEVTEGVSYYAYAFCSPLLDKELTWKENSIARLAIRYYDKNNVSGNVLNKDIQIEFPNDSYSGYDIKYHLKYTINHLPPSWATHYQFMYGGSNVVNHFSIPIFVDNINGILSDISEVNNYTELDLTQAINRVYDANNASSIGNFDLVKGDRVRIYGSITQFGVRKLIEYIDEAVLEVGDKIILPSFNKYNEYANWISTSANYRPVYMFEFYRLSNTLSVDDIVYYEIGDVLPIVGGYHTASSILDTVAAQTQSGSQPAIGTINFGNAYKTYRYYTDGFYPTSLGDMFPIYYNSESLSASFMYPSKALATGRYGIVNPDNKNRTEQTLIYGGKFSSGDLNYNDINRFINPVEYLDNKYGSIKGLELKGYTLYVFQENKITTITLNRREVQLSDGTTQAVYSNDLLGEQNPWPYNVGCSHALSIQKNLFNIYFYDKNTSAWYRIGQDGLADITTASKMKNYCKPLTNNILAAIKNGDEYYIVSGYDPVKEMYWFTYRNVDNSSQNTTIAYHEPSNSFLSSYNIYPQSYASLNNNKFYSFISGVIGEMHTSLTKYTDGYVKFTFNKFPVNVKLFRNIEISAEQIWVPSEEGDILIDENSVLYQDVNSYQRYFGKMLSLLKDFHFKNHEGRWIARFLGNILNKKGVSIGGIGLVNGEILKGNTVTLKLRNTKSNYNKLKAVTIGYDISK